MTHSLSLIVSRTEVPRTSMKAIPPRRPDVAVVYVTPAGQTHVIGPNAAPMSRSRQMLSPYRWRYEVDMGDQQRTFELQRSPLPARERAYSFRCRIDVGFRVHDPVEIVYRDIEDALAVVYKYLARVCRGLSSQHQISDSYGLEQAINRCFFTPHLLPQGITIYYTSASIEPDGKAREYLDRLANAEFDQTVGTAEHDVRTKAAEHDGELEILRTRNAIRDLSVESLIRAHLARHPEDTATAMTMLTQYLTAQTEAEHVKIARADELLRYMVDSKVLQAVDMDSVRSGLLTRLGVPAPAITAGAAPAAGPPPVAPTPVPAAPAAPVGDAWNAPLTGGPVGPTVIEASPLTRTPITPFYVVMDNSSAVRDWVSYLSAGVRAVYDTLGATPRVADAIRLSAFGYSDAVAAGPALTAPGPDLVLPTFSGSGETRYAPALAHLHQRIPRDVEELKRADEIVRRPQVLFLAGASPTDDNDWSAARGALAELRCAPVVLACGIGRVDPGAIARLASDPHLALIADESDPRLSIQRYFAFAARLIVDYGTAVIEGSQPIVQTPEGFRLALPTG